MNTDDLQRKLDLLEIAVAEKEAEIEAEIYKEAYDAGYNKIMKMYRPLRIHYIISITIQVILVAAAIALYFTFR